MVRGKDLFKCADRGLVSEANDVLQLVFFVGRNTAERIQDMRERVMQPMNNAEQLFQMTQECR